MIYFTSDTHFGHVGRPIEEGGNGGIIGMAKRPFRTIEEHDDDLIRRWNEVVGKNDDIYHLGDIVFAKDRSAAIEGLLKKLNGRIHICWGNHDHKPTRKMAHLFASAQDVKQIKIEGNSIFLSHYAHRAWNKSHHGSYHFFGHSHGGMPAFGRSLDVGVDCWDYFPVTFNQIRDRLEELGTHNDFKKHHPDEADAD